MSTETAVDTKSNQQTQKSRFRLPLQIQFQSSKFKKPTARTIMLECSPGWTVRSLFDHAFVRQSMCELIVNVAFPELPPSYYPQWTGRMVLHTHDFHALLYDMVIDPNMTIQPTDKTIIVQYTFFINEAKQLSGDAAEKYDPLRSVLDLISGVIHQKEDPTPEQLESLCALAPKHFVTDWLTTPKKS